MAKSGRHFLQIPGPTNVPDRVLRSLSRPTIDHRGPDFAVLAKEVLSGLKDVFRTSSPVIVYPGSGTGAWEASLVNTLSPGASTLTSAASIIPVPLHPNNSGAFLVPKIGCNCRITSANISRNSRPRCEIIGSAMAARTRAGTAVGPGSRNL